MSSEIAIKVENLSKCYQIYNQPSDRLKQFVLPRFQRALGAASKQYFSEFWALNDVSFEVKKAETVGIIGRNGSGKSTLLQLICGTLNPTSGSIQIHGRIAALLELGSGFNPEFTGRENVFMNGAVLGLSREEVYQRFNDIAAFADIGDFIEQPVKTYSSGMVVRLAFAVAINVDPDILVVDEALSVGDELFQRKCFARIEAIRASGATILLVSHSGTQIIEYCDRAILLESGKQIFSGSPKDTVGLFQKLLYAPFDKKNNIRTEIILKSPQIYSQEDIGQNSEPVVQSKSFTQNDFDETFDPNLVPSSTIEFESHGPLIDVPCIYTQDGRKVNGLIRGSTYLYCYRVKFSIAASRVRFGMSIKSTTGFSLAGALTAPDMRSAIELIPADSLVNVQFKFKCNFNPGVYFMNAGVFGLLNGDEVVLHRRADIIAFRVLPISSNIETEIVSLSFEPLVTVHE